MKGNFYLEVVVMFGEKTEGDHNSETHQFAASRCSP